VRGRLPPVNGLLRRAASGETGLRDLEGMTACLIVDGRHVERFAHRALELAVQRGLEVPCVFVCENTTARRRPLKHGAYYLYKLLFLRSTWTEPMPWVDLLPSDVPVHRFSSEWEGIWQRVPRPAIDEMAGYGVDVVLRFGMTLLRDPEDLPAPGGVLSFHHGDPAEYRGRPAGFYEVLDGADHLGVMVQRLGNRLDAGAVLAYGAVKVQPHSYRHTLDQAFGNGAHLLPKALRAVRAGEEVEHATGGRNYRLPSNRTVLRFAVTLLRRKVRRLLYGLTREKRWRLARAGGVDPTQLDAAHTLSVREELPAPRRFALLADPAVVDEQTLLCEALERRSGRGRLGVIRDGRFRTVDTSRLGSGHLSYPHVVRDGGEFYLLPEMAQVGPQRLARLSDDLSRVTETWTLAGLEDLRLTDPTLFRHHGRWWLFAGQPGSAADTLFLWEADDLRGPYRPHPDSPIVMDPARARMAGPIWVSGGRLFRPGQDNRRGYGDGVVLSEITHLDEDAYWEVPAGELRIDGRHGPHTIERWGEVLVLDLYDEVIDPRAALRRLRSRLQRR
jgi:hypothetical protein